MIDEKLVRLRIYRKNVERYLGLLQTTLTEIERQYVERRLTEEQSAMELLSASSFQIAVEANGARQACSRQPGFNAAEKS
ncbi:MULTISPECIES: hypothetical protein [unclassified Bradyrhizobium]|jgi:hypothetical protein|uniref:hypothetical protein n=1 Tax=unclassified Bradyrhizobium TaxID=2631580 RepID=UPI000380B879|nr:MULTISPECIES: hypothetical protein [unclassified Bradyrhizobium]MCK1306686.1 hypothetical protein [Bradyrhizobium sp. 45]MCK1317378.1 hypothetical protein [Bradyrhizobium sp. 23]MCK1325051.1 hypothetical protein [Bradyrhizobium sp. 156]MCK1328222.1 hypothetical protein [Bradyrhizobium sp. CW9]MCK1345801.1 hypothetical protein [Bradyrhizobium sp. CW11]